MKLRQRLWGVFVNSAVYVASDRLLWPGDHTLTNAIVRGVLAGIILEILAVRREVRKSEGEETEYPPIFYFGLALVCLGLDVAGVIYLSAPPLAEEWFGLLLFTGVGGLLVAGGFQARRRILAKGIAP